jgi:oligosaccharide repeat unit polymerase
MKTLIAHLLLLLVLGLIVTVFPPYGVDPASVAYGAAIAVSLMCFWCLLSWKLSGGLIFEPYALFLIAAICFNAGHILLFASGVNIPTSLMTGFSSETSLMTMMVIALGLSSFHFGGLLANWRRRGKYAAVPATQREIRLRAITLVGLVMFAISLPAWLYMTYSRVDRAMQYGYFLASFGMSTPTGLAHLPELLANALAPAMVFLVVGGRAMTALRRGSLLVMLIFSAATLFTGSKGPAVMALLAFAWVWHTAIRPLRKTLVAAGAITLAVVVIPLTTAIREVAGRDRASLEAVTSAYLEINNPVVAFLSETGWTATTVAHTIELVPAVRGYDYGESYMYSALAVLPNPAGGLHPAREHGFLADWLVTSLAPEYAARGGGWGFSFIAEAYANFGLYGAPVALALIGYLLGHLFTSARFSSDPAWIATVGACLCSCLLYARGESGLLLRDIVWYAFIPLLLVGLVTRKYFRRASRPDHQQVPTHALAQASRR